MRGEFPVSFAVPCIAVLALLEFFRINDAYCNHVAWGFSMLVVPSRRKCKKPKPTSTTGSSFLTLGLSKQAFPPQEEGERLDIDVDDATLHNRNPLGINLGQDYYLALNETDREALRSEIKEMIDRRISTGILDLQQLHDKWERHVEEDLESLEQAMTLNGILESKRFATRLDSIVGKFLNQTAVSRKRTRDLFYLDEMERAQKAKEAEKRKAKRKRGSVDGSFQKQSWKKTNDAWDDWDTDDW